MALAHIIALLRRIFRTSIETMTEASELRRRMMRHHPHMED